MNKLLATSGAVSLSALWAAAPAYSQDTSLEDLKLPASSFETRQHFSGMPYLRPPAEHRRHELGFPAPRPSAEILQEIDRLDKPTIGERTHEALADYRRAVHDYSVRMANLTAELMESGYEGDRYAELMEQRSHALEEVLESYHELVMEPYSYLKEISKQGGERQALAADTALTSWKLLLLNHIGWAFSSKNMGEIIALEEKNPQAPQLYGYFVTEAMEKWSDEEKAPWLEWLERTAPPESIFAAGLRAERAIGHPIRITGPGIDGENIDTQQWNERTIVLAFWAEWCGPCKVQMPGLIELAKKYGDKLQVIGVYCDATPASAREFLEGIDCDWPQLVDTALLTQTIDGRDRVYKSFQHSAALQCGVQLLPSYGVIERGVFKGLFQRQELEAQLNNSTGRQEKE